MKKCMVFMILGVFLFCGYAAVASAGQGNYRKGKYTFRKNCRSCHNNDGTAVSLSPDSKTQAQWKRIFKPKKFQKLACRPEWEKLSADARDDVLAYLHKFAFDSPTPAKCK